MNNWTSKNSLGHINRVVYDQNIKHVDVRPSRSKGGPKRIVFAKSTRRHLVAGEGGRGSASVGDLLLQPGWLTPRPPACCCCNCLLTSICTSRGAQQLQEQCLREASRRLEGCCMTRQKTTATKLAASLIQPVVISTIAQSLLSSNLIEILSFTKNLWKYPGISKKISRKIQNSSRTNPSKSQGI